jgi:rhodanese-related sulfurtransferase
VFNNLLKRNAPAIETIYAAEATKLHGREDVIFVDVRGSDEIARSGTVKGALRAPLPGLANFAKPDGSGLLPGTSSGAKIILVCASGMRSATAARQLAAMGYPNLANLHGGFGQWMAAGGHIER